MPELIPVVIVAALMFAAGFAGYRAGTEKAQREAFYTVSTLRESLARTRLEASRLTDANRRLGDAVKRVQQGDPELPEWML